MSCRCDSPDIMTLKRKGELGLEEIYANAPQEVTYTIVRPGGLTDGPSVGPTGIFFPCTCGEHPVGGRAEFALCVQSGRYPRSWWIRRYDPFPSKMRS